MFIWWTLEWMDKLGVIRIRVAIKSGDETALKFYRKFGFKSHMTVLELRQE
jgi:hypothetical protein